MITFHKSMLILALVGFCLGLHQHLAADTNVQYYEALLERESELKSSLTVISKEIESLNRTLAKLEGHPSLQIVAVSDVIADENNILEQIARNHTLPSLLKSVNCTNVSQSDIDNLTISIQAVENDLQEVGIRIAELEGTHDNVTESLILQYRWAEIYLAQLQNASLALNKCPKQVEQGNGTSGVIGIGNVSNYTNGSNLTVPNWVYGNTTVADFNIKLFKFLTSNNVTSCPEHAPFVLAGTTHCSACVQPTPLFDANQAKCIAGCPSNTTLNQTTHKCESTASALECKNGQIKTINNQGQQICQCPQSTPYFTGQSCISCFLPNHWNTTTLSCEQCPSGTIYSIQTDRCTICPHTAPLEKNGRCHTCPQNSYYNNQTNQCLSCPNGTKYNASTELCERVVCDKGQYEYQGACYSCPQGTHYDEDQHTCLSCPQGTRFDENTQKCVGGCTGGTVYNETVGQCACPSDRPFSNGRECLACDRPRYWSSGAKACLECPQGTVVNTLGTGCVAIGGGSNGTETNGSSEDSCAKNTFWNGDECVTCFLPQYWNLDTRSCQWCQSGKNYDTSVKKCVVCQEGQVFDLNLYKCVDDGSNTSSSGSSSSSSSGSSTSGSSNSCPSSTPFWNGNSCVSCFLPRHWNHDRRQCEECPAGQNYDVSARRCLVCPSGKTFNFSTYRCQ